jgi:hypothetical protein
LKLELADDGGSEVNRADVQLGKKRSAGGRPGAGTQATGSVG